MKKLETLYEDNHLLVVNKPARIATMGAASGPTLHSMAVEYLRQKYNKPGNVYVGVVSRLDAMTSGVIVLARTSKAASRLAPQFAATETSGEKATKTYLAIVAGRLRSSDGAYTDRIFKDDAAKRMRVAANDRGDAKEARLSYHVIAKNEDRSLVAVRLQTGRKHQIRLQFSSRGHHVLGDRKYNARQPFAEGIALHSFCLTVKHPTRVERMTWTVPPPKYWRSALRDLDVPEDLATLTQRIDWNSRTAGEEPAT